MTRIGFYPGSFDPVTIGHLDVIARAARLFDRLVVGVGTHHIKEPLLSDAARIALLREVVAPIAADTGTEITVSAFNGLAVHAALEAGAAIVVRGLRDSSDFDYELRMASMNRAMEGRVDTVFLTAAPEVNFISSTLVRQIAAMGGDVSAFVPEAAVRAIAARGR
jgi:pantetheine-phosphate adenylyltransferase